MFCLIDFISYGFIDFTIFTLHWVFDCSIEVCECIQIAKLGSHKFIKRQQLLRFGLQVSH